MTSAQVGFELCVTLVDGRSLVAAVPSGEEWLTEHANRILTIRSDTTWTTVGHGLPTVVPVDVEGHVIALRLPTPADADALRRALALGALSATLLVSSTTSSLTPLPLNLGSGETSGAVVTITQERSRPAAFHKAAALNPAVSQRAAPPLSDAGVGGVVSPAYPNPPLVTPPDSRPAETPAEPPAPWHGDLLTPQPAYQEWRVTLLDTIYRLPASYAPNDLVSVGEAGLVGSGRVRSLVIADLRAMTVAAREAGNPVVVVSGYRSYDKQKTLFERSAARHGYDQAVREIARPGHSEHQLGTTLDFKSAGGPAPWSLPDWAATPAGGWMLDNAWRFGFVLSYPKAATEITGYIYEPWHYRYVGRESAAAIHASGLITRQWLWRNGARQSGVPDPAQHREQGLSAKSGAPGS